MYCSYRETLGNIQEMDRWLTLRIHLTPKFCAISKFIYFLNNLRIQKLCLHIGLHNASCYTVNMTKTQKFLKKQITAHLKLNGSDEIVYCSEYLGYLPFGFYHWIECNGESIDKLYSFDWSSEDITALENIGFLKQIKYWQNPKDEL